MPLSPVVARRMLLGAAAMVFIVLLGAAISLLMSGPGHVVSSDMGAASPSPSMTVTESAQPKVFTLPAAGSPEPAAPQQRAQPAPTTPTSAATHTVAVAHEEPPAQPEPTLEPDPAVEPDANAATYYAEAFEQMRGEGLDRAMPLVEDAVAKGWGNGDARVDRVLDAKRSAFDSLRKGAMCRHCSFAGPAAEASEREPAYVSHATTLATLAAADALRLADKGLPARALLRAADVVKLAYDVRRDKTKACVQAEQAMVAAVFPLLADLLQNAPLTADALQRALDRLKRAEPGIGDLGYAMSTEVYRVSDDVHRLLQSEAYFSGKPWQPSLPRRIQRIMLSVPVNQRQGYVMAALAEFDRWCERIRSVAKGMRRRHVESLAKDAAKVRVDSSAFAFGRKPAELGAYCAVEFIPSLKPLWEAEAEDAVNRGALAAMIAVRLWHARKREWPESLDALVKEKLLPAAPTDPYDAQDRSLRYARTGVGAALWSVGRDGKDNRGDEIRDVVFRMK